MKDKRRRVFVQYYCHRRRKWLRTNRQEFQGAFQSLCAGTLPGPLIVKAWTKTGVYGRVHGSLGKFVAGTSIQKRSISNMDMAIENITRETAEALLVESRVRGDA